jgi:hypothetical protein
LFFKDKSVFTGLKHKTAFKKKFNANVPLLAHLKPKHKFVNSNSNSYFEMIISSLNFSFLPDAPSFEHFAQFMKNYFTLAILQTISLPELNFKIFMYKK